jgi:hypothetical protein
VTTKQAKASPCDVPGVDDETRKSPEYVEGLKAFDRGEPNSENPYPRGDKRTRWFVGWYDAKYEPMLLM